MVQRFRFRRRQRLHLQRDFVRLFARRCSASDGLLVIYVDANALAWSRLGIKAGKRLGGAVVRNRIKRRIREAFRLRQQGLPEGLDVLCIPRPGTSADAGVDAFGESLDRLIARAVPKLDRQARRRDVRG